MSFKIIADSSANIWELPDENYSSVPLKIILGEKEYVDVKGLDVASFVEEMSISKEKCGTSCPNVFDWLEAFGDEKEIFVVTITSKLSGSYSAAVQAREDYINNNPDAKVCVIDSLSAGPEMGLIVEKLLEFDAQGLSFEEAEKEIKKYSEKTQLLFSLQSLRNLAKNGRVSNTVARIAGVLGIRVVGMAKTGVLEPLHKCRGEKKALEAIKEEMLKLGYKGGKLRIAHCENSDSAKEIVRKIKEIFADIDVKIAECTALCSFYAERGGLLIGFETP